MPWCVLWLLCGAALAANPLVPSVGMADPHIHFWPSVNRFFLYATHDFSSNNTNYLMKNWWVWSSQDLVAWTEESVLWPQDTPAPASAFDECWATDGAYSPALGQYFFYLSIGPDQVAVVNASTPFGPWDNALGVPLLTQADGQNAKPLPTQFRDPCVFTDRTDGASYILSGVFHYYMARLSDDMLALAEPLRYVEVVNAVGPFGFNITDDKPFLHQSEAHGLYYLSWGCFYAVSHSVYGPYTYVGSVVQTASIAPAYRMNQTTGPWYTHEDLMDRHGSFFAAHGQWYFAANDRSHSTAAIGDRQYFRDTVAGYLHFFANGSMAPVAIDARGVHAHNATARIEAEEYFSVADDTDDGSDDPVHPSRNHRDVAATAGATGASGGGKPNHRLGCDVVKHYIGPKDGDSGATRDGGEGTWSLVRYNFGVSVAVLPSKTSCNGDLPVVVARRRLTYRNVATHGRSLYAMQAQFHSMPLSDSPKTTKDTVPHAADCVAIAATLTCATTGARVATCQSADMAAATRPGLRRRAPCAAVRPDNSYPDTVHVEVTLSRSSCSGWPTDTHDEDAAGDLLLLDWIQFASHA